jgi:predicted lipid-binding transport protein (Tim44 family)
MINSPIQNPANSSLPAHSENSQSVQLLLSAVGMIGIVILGAYSGMWAYRFFHPEPQGYIESATQSGKPTLEKAASSQSEHVKTAHQEEPAKQKAEVLPGVKVATLTSADIEPIVANDLQQLSISDIIVHFIGHPYLTLQDKGGKLM